MRRKDEKEGLAVASGCSHRLESVASVGLRTCESGGKKRLNGGELVAEKEGAERCD